MLGECSELRWGETLNKFDNFEDCLILGLLETVFSSLPDEKFSIVL